jgi:hypothetical protein
MVLVNRVRGNTPHFARSLYVLGLHVINEKVARVAAFEKGGLDEDALVPQSRQRLRAPSVDFRRPLAHTFERAGPEFDLCAHGLAHQSPLTIRVGRFSLLHSHPYFSTRPTEDKSRAALDTGPSS